MALGNKVMPTVQTKALAIYRSGTNARSNTYCAKSAMLSSLANLTKRLDKYMRRANITDADAATLRGREALGAPRVEHGHARGAGQDLRAGEKPVVCSHTLAVKRD